MKRMACMLMGTLMIVLLVGCSDIPPTSYGAAIWASETPDIWFEVQEEGDYSSVAEGELTLGDKKIPFSVSFGHPGTYLVFQEFIKVAEDDLSTDYPGAFYTANDGWYTSNILFAGEPKYSSKKMVVTVDKKLDNVFNGEVDKIEFIRYDIEETETD